jgi:hypothetical protein
MIKYEASSDDEDDSTPEKVQPKQKNKDDEKKKTGLFSGVKNFFKLNKKEARERRYMSTKSKKLPKNFA